MSDNVCLEVAKVVVGIATGVGLIWMKEAVAGWLERRRKQRALWMSCAVEAEGAMTEFEQMKWLKDRIRQGAGIGGAAHTLVASSTLAEKLVELDPKNTEPYLALIMRTAQFAQKTADARKSLDDAARASDEERQSTRGLVESDVLHAARMFSLQTNARLRLLRVLREHAPDAVKSGEIIARVEQDARVIESAVQEWTDEYGQLIDRTKELQALAAAQGRSSQ